MHKFLVVDDEPTIVDLITQFLRENFDCDVDSKSNGMEAFLATQESHFDLIITDFKMPVMNGGAFVDALRMEVSPNKNTPIVFVSAFIDDAMKSSAEQTGVQFLEKPIDMDNLKEVVLKAVSL
jgi:CheY-like chemotaxis protein